MYFDRIEVSSKFIAILCVLKRDPTLKCGLWYCKVHANSV